MEAVNGVAESAGDKGGPPPPSPLTGCYLLIVIGEPHCHEHKDIILQRVAKGLLSWDVNDCLVDLEKELAVIFDQGLEGEEARYGERLIQFASENLVTEILIHPVVSTLVQCVRNLLSSFTRHRHIIYAGYTFANNGSWVLQDGTFSFSDFAEAFQEIEVLRVIRAYENGISLDVHCAPEGDWPRLPKEPFARGCKVRVNPNDVLTAGSPAITSFINYLQPFVVPAELQNILESSDVVGNIRFSRPTLYVFPGGQGDAALFGINGFNMLLDGGFSRKACFWDFVRHLDRLDAVLLTRLNNSNVNGITAVLRRKRQNAVYPQVGHFFCNIQERKALLSPDGDKDKDPLLINLLEEGHEIVSNLRHLGLAPQVCYRDSEPINLYHKVGHGTLDMYVLSPAKDSREVREFLQKWNNNDQKLFANPKNNKDFVFPLQNLVSVCALLVWQPANPEDTITRILFPGSTPQNKIFEGLDRIKSLEFIKHPVCSVKSLAPLAKSKQSVLDKIIPNEKRITVVDNKKEKPKPPANNTINENELKNGEINGIHTEKIAPVKKSDSTESEKSVTKAKKIIENGDKQKPKPKIEPKVKPRSDSQQRKVKTVEKSSPKKIISDEIKSKQKSSPVATPAKSTKDANNRKVLESKTKSAPKKELSKPPAPEKKETKVERKPISRRPKDISKIGSPSKKVNGIQKPDTISRRGKLDKEGTTDSSTVSTPSADQDSILKKDISKLTSDELQHLKEKELAELKEEQEAVKELEAVFRKGEMQEDKSSDFRKIKDLSIDDKLESEEYLIIEKTEIEAVIISDTKEDETQKLIRDSEESEKQRKLSNESDIKELKDTKETAEAVKEKEVEVDDAKKNETGKLKNEVIGASKEASITSPDEKLDISSDKKVTDKDNENKEAAPESQPDEKGSTNIESGQTTTAPTLPEDERMPLDEIKEDNGDQVIEEKHVKEDTKEKDVPVIQISPKTYENIAKLPPVVGIRLDKQAHIRDIVKTPDEVADLPVHEEVDIDNYTDYGKEKSPEEADKKVEHKCKITTPPKISDEMKKNEEVVSEELNKKELSKSPDEEKDTDELEVKKEATVNVEANEEKELGKETIIEERQVPRDMSEIKKSNDVTEERQIPIDILNKSSEITSEGLKEVKHGDKKADSSAEADTPKSLFPTKIKEDEKEYGDIENDFEKIQFPEVPQDEVLTHHFDKDRENPTEESRQVIHEHIKTVKEDVTSIKKIDEKLQRLKDAAEEKEMKSISEIVRVESKMEEPQHAESVIIASQPDSPETDEKKIEDKTNLGTKSPKEREEDVAKIVASVAEVLKSEAPLEEFEGKVPILPTYKSYTTELRETHITTLDSPVTEEHKQITSDVAMTKSFLEEERKIAPIHEEIETEENRVTKMMEKSQELIQASSKITSDIKQSPSIVEPEDQDGGTVHRMLVTTSSEDGGEEIEICPPGTITFSRSSESSGRSSPDNQSQRLSQKSGFDISTDNTVIAKIKKEDDEEVIKNSSDPNESIHQVVDKIEQVDKKSECASEEDESDAADRLQKVVGVLTAEEEKITKEAAENLKESPTINKEQNKSDNESGTTVDEGAKKQHEDEKITVKQLGKDNDVVIADHGKAFSKEKDTDLSVEECLRDDKDSQPDEKHVIAGLEKVEQIVVGVIAPDVEKKLSEERRSSIADHEHGKVSCLVDEKIDIKHVATGLGKVEELAVGAVVPDVERKLDEEGRSSIAKNEDDKSKVDEKHVITDGDKHYNIAEYEADKTSHPTGKKLEEKHVASALEKVEEVLIGAIAPNVEKKLEKERRSSTAEHKEGLLGKLEKDIEQIIEKGEEEVKEIVEETKDAVKSFFRKDSHEEEILEKSAEDIEKNYEVVSDMSKSVIFEKVDKQTSEDREKKEQVLEHSAKSIEKDFETVSDLTKSISFEKCSKEEVEKLTHATDNLIDDDKNSSQDKEKPSSSENFIDKVEEEVKKVVDKDVEEIQDEVTEAKEAVQSLFRKDSKQEDSEISAHDIEKRYDVVSELSKSVLFEKCDKPTIEQIEQKEKVLETTAKNLEEDFNAVCDMTKSVTFDKCTKAEDNKLTHATHGAEGVFNLKKEDDENKDIDKGLGELKQLSNQVSSLVEKRKIEPEVKHETIEAENGYSSPEILEKVEEEVEKIVDKGIEIISETTDAVKSIFRKDSQQEEILEKAAEDLEKNFNIVSEMSRSVVFEKIDNKPTPEEIEKKEKLLEERAKNVEHDFEAVTDLSKSVEFEKCSKAEVDKLTHGIHEAEGNGKEDETKKDIGQSLAELKELSAKASNLVESRHLEYQSEEKPAVTLTKTPSPKLMKKVDDGEEKIVEKDVETKDTVSSLFKNDSQKEEVLEKEAEYIEENYNKVADMSNSVIFEKCDIPTQEDFEKKEKIFEQSAKNFEQDLTAVSEMTQSVIFEKFSKEEGDKSCDYAKKEEKPEEKICASIEKLKDMTSELNTTMEKRILEDELKEETSNIKVDTELLPPETFVKKIDEVEKIIEKGVEEVNEFVSEAKEAVTSIFRRSSQQEEVLEKSAQDIEKNFEALSDMSKSVIFEKCSENVFEKIGHDIEDNYNIVSDMAKSISFDKCDKPQSDLKSSDKIIEEHVVDMTKSVIFDDKSKNEKNIVEEIVTKFDAVKNNPQPDVAKESVDEIERKEDLKPGQSKKSEDESKEAGGFVEFVHKIEHDAEEVIKDEIEKIEGMYEYTKEAIFGKDDVAKAETTKLEAPTDSKGISRESSGKSTPDIKESEQLKSENKDSLLSGKSSPALSGKTSPGLSGRSTPDLKETEQMQTTSKDSLLSGKSSPGEAKGLDLQLASSADIKMEEKITKTVENEGFIEKIEHDIEDAAEKGVEGVKGFIKGTEDAISSMFTSVFNSNNIEEQSKVTESEAKEQMHTEASQVENKKTSLEVIETSEKKLSVSDVEISLKEATEIETKKQIDSIDSGLGHEIGRKDNEAASNINITAPLLKEEIHKAAEVHTTSSSLSPIHSSAEALSGKSTPDIAEIEKLNKDKHIQDSATPPTVPVSPVVRDDVKPVSTVKTCIVSSLRDNEVPSSTPASDDYEIGISTQSDISSSQFSKTQHQFETEGEDSDEDDDLPGSPLSVTSQVAHSRSSSRYDFDDDRIGTKLDPMNTSFYGALPDDDDLKKVSKSDEFDFEKAMSEHRQVRGRDLVEGSPSYLYEVTKAKFSVQEDSASSSTGESQLDQHNKNDPSNVMTASFIGSELPQGVEKKDPFDSWGKPLGLPSPAPPNDSWGTPKKEKKLPPNVTAKNKLNDDKKRAESPSKYNRNKKVNPVYVDLTYVPHHGNAYYSYVDFFKKVRARYYVFSGIEPSREVYNALLEAKQTWEDKELEVTIIPTYDTDILGYWVAENEELLTKYKIDLSPSASRCTINLQDHETSCSAYRLEF